MNRRLALYALLDLIVWGIVAYLLSTDPTHNRLRLLWGAKRAAQSVAEASGALALRCEARYYAVASQ